MKGGKSRSRDVRDTSDIANPRLLLPLIDLTAIPPSDLLRSIEDRRAYYPERAVRPASLFSKPRHRLQMSPGTNLFKLPIGVGFEDSARVLVCVRRAKRRQVMFALKKAGRGGGSRKRRKGPYTDVKC